MKRTSLKAVGIAAAAVLALAGCANDDPASGGEGGGGHNQADVTFAQEMIPHHAQAVQMAEMAQESAASGQVKELAEDIRSAQDPEIELMTGWLEAWGEDVPEAGGMSGEGAGDMDHGMDHDASDGDSGAAAMPGMMSEQEMDDLGAASGATFDTMWLEMMIEHHEGAIEMARTEQATGENPDAIALAEDIETAQAEEIGTMERLLGS